MVAVTRGKELKKRRTRMKKLTTLRKRYVEAKTPEQKAGVVGKMKRVAPWLSEEEFLSPLQK